LRRDVYRCLGYNTDTWIIDRESIEKYKNDLINNSLLKSKFECIFKFYGAVRIDE